MEETAYRSLYEREMTHWFCIGRRKIIRATLARESLPPGRVLEIGSGTGGNIGLLRQFGTLTCIEPSPLGRALTALRMSYFNTLLFPIAVVARLASRILRVGTSLGSPVPSAGANAALGAVFGAEVPLIRRVNFPWGLSIVAVCEAEPEEP